MWIVVLFVLMQCVLVSINVSVEQIYSIFTVISNHQQDYKMLEPRIPQSTNICLGPME
jgi:hypothetical protein